MSERIHEQKSLLLVFNAHAYGGTELIFFRACKYFINIGWQVSMFGEGTKEFIQRYGDSDMIATIDFEPAGEYDYLVCAGIAIGQLNKLQKKEIHGTRIIIWAFGEAGLKENVAFGYRFRLHFGKIAQFWFGLIYRLFLGRHLKASEDFLRSLVNLRALYFSDAIGRAESTGRPISLSDEAVLQIPVSKKNGVLEPKMIFGLLRVAWVGRVSFDFKVYPLLKAAKDAAEYCRARRIKLKFTIIGDGDALSFLKTNLATLSSEDIAFDFLGFVDAETVPVRLENNVDVMVGMGTASLDAAAFGVPSAIINPARSIKTAAQCQYRWLFESPGYSLGEFIEYGREVRNIGRSFEEIMADLTIRPQEIRDQCRAYGRSFEEETVFESLLAKLPQSNTSSLRVCADLVQLQKLNRIFDPVVRFAKIVFRR